MNKKIHYLAYLLRVVLLLFVWLTPIQIESKEKSSQEILMDHTRDDYSWHIASRASWHLTLHLPVIIYKQKEGLSLFSSKHLYDAHHNPLPYKGFIIDEKGKIQAIDGKAIYDLSITKNIANLLLNILLMLLLLLGMAAHYRKRKDGIPRGIWTLLALLVRFIDKKVAKEYIGAKHYRRFSPYLLTIFFFILINNLMGLLPAACNVIGNLSATLVLASFTFLVTNLNGSRQYWSHIFAPPGVPKWLYPILVPLELVSVFIKPITLMVRLLANTLAGHLMLLNIIGVIFFLQHILAAFISVPIGTFMMFLEIFVTFLQAYVFTMLSAIYIGAAVVEH